MPTTIKRNIINKSKNSNDWDVCWVECELPNSKDYDINFKRYFFVKLYSTLFISYIAFYISIYANRLYLEVGRPSGSVLFLKISLKFLRFTCKILESYISLELLQRIIVLFFGFP